MERPLLTGSVQPCYKPQVRCRFRFPLAIFRPPAPRSSREYCRNSNAEGYFSPLGLAVFCNREPHGLGPGGPRGTPRGLGRGWGHAALPRGPQPGLLRAGLPPPSRTPNQLCTKSSLHCACGKCGSQLTRSSLPGGAALLTAYRPDSRYGPVEAREQFSSPLKAEESRMEAA
jgi:hypothetical protein